MNWYKKSQMVNKINQLEYLINTDEENHWADNDIKNLHEELLNDAFVEWDRIQRALPYDKEKKNIFTPLVRNPPPTKLKSVEEIKNEIRQESFMFNENMTYYIEMWTYIYSDYKKTKNIYNKLLKAVPQNDVDIKNKTIKKRQYENKINAILNGLNYYKYILEFLNSK
jgi:hypothetical protein